MIQECCSFAALFYTRSVRQGRGSMVYGSERIIEELKSGLTDFGTFAVLNKSNELLAKTLLWIVTVGGVSANGSTRRWFLAIFDEVSFRLELQKVGSGQGDSPELPLARRHM